MDDGEDAKEDDQDGEGELVSDASELLVMYSKSDEIWKLLREVNGVWRGEDYGDRLRDAIEGEAYGRCCSGEDEAQSHMKSACFEISKRLREIMFTDISEAKQE